MCQVDRFFLLLASFARHILGDDDNAAAALARAAPYIPIAAGDHFRSRIRSYIESFSE